MSDVRIKKRNRLKSVSLPAEIMIHLLVGGFAILCILPFIFVIIISFSSEESIRMIGYSFRPLEWSTAAYKFVFDMGVQLWRSYFNSFFVAIVGTTTSLIMCVLYAYALFRQDFKYRNFMALFSYFTMIFGGGLVPTVIVVKQILHLGNSIWAVILSPFLNPFFIIMLRTFFQTSVPEELIEAASIDGSGEYRTLFQIVIPISKPGIATVALLTALNYWNDWFLSLLYIKDNTKFVLQYLLMRMQNDVDFIKKNQAMVGAGAQEIMKNLPNLTLRMAMVVFVVVPITLAYPFFQRYIIGGLTVGSVKG